MEKPSLKYIKELSGGDTDFEKKLIAVVQAELPGEMALYKENMENHAFAKAAENVHKLKHKFGILSLEKSYQVAIDYEEQLQQGEIVLGKEFESILERIQDFLLTLSLE